MNKDYKEKLVELGAESLADTLLELSYQSNKVADYLEVLLSPPDENIDKIEKKLNSLKRSKRFVSRPESTYFSQELVELLQKIKSLVHDPFTGVQLIIKFFEADRGILGHSDDSYGCIGDVFRFDATKLFIDYANRYENKQKLADLVLKVNRVNDFGIRDLLVDCAVDYLPEPIIRDMIKRLQKQAKKTPSSDYDPNSYLISSLAQQLKDPQLYEETKSALYEDMPSSIMLDIAQVYFESDQLDSALIRLQKIPTNESHHSHKKNELLIQIYKKQGNTKALSKILFSKFKKYPCEYTLQDLIEVIGEDQREGTINTQTNVILRKNTLEIQDIKFLLYVGKVNEASDHLVLLSDQLNNYYYDHLKSLAKTFEANDKILASIVLYRSLLISILQAAKTKSYPSGVSYLKKIDQLSPSVLDWKRFDNHHIFKEFILQKHGRKSSFWSKYTK